MSTFCTFEIGFYILGAVLKRKINLGFLLATLKPHKNFCSGFPSLSLVDCLQITSPVFRSIFRITRPAAFRTTFRVTSSYRKSRLPEENYTAGRITQLVSNFLEPSRNFALDFFPKKAAKNCENHQR
jgi:hypothetical protein